MATQVKMRRGTETEHQSFTGATGEVTVDTTNNSLVVHDGLTAGGHLINKLKFKSVQALLSSPQSLALGDTVNTGVTDWRVVPATNVGLVLANGLEVIPLNGAWLADWLVDLTGVNAADTEIAQAITLNRTVMLPNGKTKILSRKVVGTNVRVRGTGPECTIDAQMTDVLFEFPQGTGRSVKMWEGFSIISTDNTMVDGCAFLFPGTTTGGAIVNTSGYKFENIEIGGGGQFGCGWDVSDAFRFTIRDCGYTAVTLPVRIRGQVVQCTIDNLTGNNDGYTRLYDTPGGGGANGQNCGVYMESRNDYDDAILRVPENVKILNSGFVKHQRGIISLGLAIQTVNCDLDFIRDIGWGYGGGDSHTLKGGYIAHSQTDVPFIGALVTKVADMEAVTITGVTFSTYSVVASKQTAIQIGSGDALPYLETTGVTANDNRVVGAAGSWDFGVQADRNRSVEINGNKFKSGVIRAGGKAINASNQKNLTCNNNRCRGQEIYISAPYTTSVVTATNNDADVVTAFLGSPAENRDISRNRNVD